MGWKGMLWLSFLSFGAGFALTATAAFYGSIFIALLAILSFTMGILLYGAFRLPMLFEDIDSTNEGRKEEAGRELNFLILLFFLAWGFYLVLANMFYNTFNNTEGIIVVALPSSLGLVMLAVLFFDLLKRPPESLPQPEEAQDRQ